MKLYLLPVVQIERPAYREIPEVKARLGKRNTCRIGGLTIVLVRQVQRPCLRRREERSRSPTFAEIKHIAEEGFIYGLPIVMYYTVDATSSSSTKPHRQYKAPHRHAHQRSTCLHLQRHGRHHAQQRHALFHDLVDLRAEPTVISVPAVPKPRYYSVQFTDANTFNYGYIGSRATGAEPGDYLWSAPIGKAKRRRRSSRSSIPPPPFHLIVPHPAVQCRRYAERGQNSGRLQSRSRSRHFSSSPRRRPRPQSTIPKATPRSRRNILEYLDSALQFSPPARKKRQSARSSRASALVRAKPLI